MSSFSRVTLSQYFSLIGEDNAQERLSAFSSPKNAEIEEFVHKSALEFTKRKITITHLLINDDFDIVAMYALTHKAIFIDGSLLTSSLKKKLSKYVLPEPNSETFKISGFLIAQLGKNFAIDGGHTITGNEIMQSVFEVIDSVQAQIGGRIIYLECENKQPLLDFYQNEANNFKLFASRTSALDGTVYEQLIKIF